LHVLGDRGLNTFGVSLRLERTQRIEILIGFCDWCIPPHGIVRTCLVGDEIGSKAELHHRRQQLRRVACQADRNGFTLRLGVLSHLDCLVE